MAKIQLRKRKLSKTTEYQPKHREAMMLQYIADNQINGYYRAGNFANELIFDKRGYRFQGAKINKKTQTGLFLFGMVKKDARAYCEGRKKVQVPKKYPTNYTNYQYEYIRGGLAATDLNAAYWRIAYLHGIISENTFDHGMKGDHKTTRLAALASMGASKEYYVIKNGKITNNIVKVEGDAMLDACYRKIRYECYKMMQACKMMLGKEFYAYRTDCIYYHDTKANRKRVQEFFEDLGMECKHLTKVKAPLAQTESASLKNEN